MHGCSLAASLSSQVVAQRPVGNYLPALDKALELLQPDRDGDHQLFVLFLSDGAPSDHAFMECDHGYQVWCVATMQMKVLLGKATDPDPLTPWPVRARRRTMRN